MMLGKEAWEAADILVRPKGVWSQGSVQDTGVLTHQA